MAGSTDIKLLDNEIRVEGHRTVTAQTWDFCVDAPDRRKEHKNPHRRALVHDFHDGLSINWANDYPGGVTVNGEVKLPGDVTVNGEAKFAGGVTVDGEAKFSGAVMFRPWVKTVTKLGNAQVPGPEVLGPLRSLADVILELQQEVAALKQEVVALKK